jgi:hypothetical protein
MKGLYILISIITVVNACSSIWGQCGGQNWAGSTCCVSGSKCVFANQWYSQCLPSSTPSPTPTPTPVPTPTPTPVPTPVPTPLPTPTPTGLSSYCPAASDLMMAYYSDYNNQPKIYDQGWNTTNGGAVATKSAFNLLGGYVEYDIDLRHTLVGINANIYTISPTISSTGFVKANYCDGAKTGSAWCMELDWIESNGNCAGATTIHTVPGTGSQDCTAWGCASRYSYNGNAKFHMKITYGTDGKMLAYRDGVLIPNYSPVPNSNAWNTIATTMKSKGAVIYSSQWQGWVPLESTCGTGGNLANSQYSISNLRIVGKVVQGPVPKLC